MIECRECGEEIQEVDAFCPFCGIAIVGVAVGEPTEEESTPSESVETTTDVISASSVDIDEDQLAETMVGVPADFLKKSDDDLQKDSKESPSPEVEAESAEVEESPSDSEAGPVSLIEETVDESAETDSESPEEFQAESDQSSESDGFISTTELEESEKKETTAAVDESEEVEESEDARQAESTDEDSAFEALDRLEETLLAPSAGSEETDLESDETPDTEESSAFDSNVDNSTSEEPTDQKDKAETFDPIDPMLESNPIIDARDLTPEVEASVSGEASDSEEVDGTTDDSLESVEEAAVTGEDKVEEEPLETDFTDGETIVNFEVQEEVREARESARLSALASIEEANPEEPVENESASQDTVGQEVEKDIPLPVESVESEEGAIHSTSDGDLTTGDVVEEDPVGDSSEELSESDASEVVVSTDDEAEDSRPQTTPNIGQGDTDGGKTPKLEPLEEGVLLNSRYEIVRKIGGGGMGAVYLASDKNLGGVLRAVKEMVQSYIEREQQEKAVQDFKRESMLLTSLEHPAIPTIYDYFFDDQAGRFYLVMKYISGGDLSARLRAAPEGRLDEISVTQWGLEIADVLSYLHNRQPPIVYRDLKPANIMIDGNNSKIMLIDFGIARWVNKEEKGVTAVGTMGYAPPELFSGNVVPASDIYSLGSTMFHLLTGADPQNNPLLIFDFQKHPRPRQINPNLSDQMERILMKAVEYNAEKRFASAEEMKQALHDHLQRLQSDGVSYGVKETPKAVALSDQPVFCGFCGQKIVATDMFCAFCGAKQPLAQSGVQSQEYKGPLTTAKLMVEGTGDLNAPSFDLAKKESLVGRRDPMSNIFPEVDLSKFDPQTKISRKHARIFRDGEAYMLEDLGSSNGTLILQGGEHTTRLAPGQARQLQHGDKIRVGDTMLHFVVG